MKELSRLDRIGMRVLKWHGALYQTSNGRIGHRIVGIPPSLMLHTVGAKSGLPRTNTLTYARDGNDYLVVASYGGLDRSPAWYHNLRKHPDVEINVGRSRFHVRAHVVSTDDDDYARLWAVVNENNADRYDGYQGKTTRTIPIVVLTP